MRVTGPNGIDVRRHLTFDVKVPAGDIRRLTVSQLQAKGGKITLSSDLFQDLIPRRSRATITVGPTASLDVPGILAALDRYPYGCAEQTTSRALPLLYVNDVAKRMGLATDTVLRERIDGAIARVFEMQDSSGAFGVWGPSDGDMWLTSYVTDFLTRAKEAGYAVRQQPFNQALDRLQNFISYAQDFENGGEGRAYALYVLARNGRAPIGELRYYVDTRLDRFSTPLAQAQLGAALSMLGDKPRAEKALQAALKTIADKDDGLTRRDYGTGVRDGAALITLASEIGPRQGRGAAPRRRGGQGLPGQVLHLDAGAGLDAAGRARARRGGGQRRAHRQRRCRTRASWSARCPPAEVKDGALVIANESDAAVDAVVSVIGAALTPEPAVSKGFTIERTYYTLDGKKVDLASATGGNGRAQAERPAGGRAQGGVARHRRAHPGGRPAAGRPRDREPAPGRLRRHQDARLAQDHGEAGAHRLPRRPLRRRLRLLRLGRRAARPAQRRRRRGAAASR